MLRGPKVFPASVVGVEGACRQGVEEPQKVADLAFRIAQNDVVVIRQHAISVQADAVLPCRVGEEIGRQVIEDSGRLQQELSLRAATREEVGGAGDDVARWSHE